MGWLQCRLQPVSPDLTPSYKPVSSAPAPGAPRPAGEQLRLFQAVIPVFRFDIPTSLFLMPYLVHNVMALGSDGARRGVQQEIQARGRGRRCFVLHAWLPRWRHQQPP